MALVLVQANEPRNRALYLCVRALPLIMKGLVKWETTNKTFREPLKALSRASFRTVDIHIKELIGEGEQPPKHQSCKKRRERERTDWLMHFIYALARRATHSSNFSTTSYEITNEIERNLSEITKKIYITRSYKKLKERLAISIFFIVIIVKMFHRFSDRLCIFARQCNENSRIFKRVFSVKVGRSLEAFWDKNRDLIYVTDLHQPDLYSKSLNVINRIVFNI